MFSFWFTLALYAGTWVWCDGLPQWRSVSRRVSKRDVPAPAVAL